MISDNFVTGDNVYLNELKNFFFEVLGMMSITHYGCIGDGRTDNYAALQVAIEDARRRGLCYLYVPYGRFRFRGELQHLDEVTFIGNPKAKIYNDRTGEELTILQFGVMGCCKTGAVIYLEDDILLRDYVPPDLKTGIYYTGEHRVVFADEGGNISLIGPYETFYYNADDKTFCTPAFQLWYTDENYWWQDINSWSTSEIIDDDLKIPTSAAVYRELHPDFIELENMTSTYSQILDTKIKCQPKIKLLTQIKFLNTTNFQNVFGNHFSDASNMNFGIGEHNGDVRWFTVFSGNVSWSQETVSDSTTYDIEFYAGESEQYLKVNGDVVISDTQSMQNTSKATLFLFAKNASYDNLGHSSMTLNYANIYIEDTLVRELVPVRRLNDEEVCMYDKVSGRFFENVGIGAFIAGPDVPIS